MTPISSPWFSKQWTCSIPSIALNSFVRSAHTSTIRRARRGSSCAKEVSCSLVKQSTSHRPKPAPAGGVAACACSDSDGNRFSNATTS
ncbi:Uncharacterised protein [Mycobacteroides abscessus subsp. abscessus]|nr:Uncharacterised protein [Mycobacteroides abscessus subsp. abscessus]